MVEATQPPDDDDGDDGDHGLPAELEDREPDSDPPQDEIDQPDESAQ
ncbi:MAG: hypothetical protein QOE11_264 [Solirubrobacteraceae bacterium]|jgi:hypothetical protein|nr:hypothetical protein [Solirubrobacteraceae bacterium]